MTAPERSLISETPASAGRPGRAAPRWVVVASLAVMVSVSVVTARAQSPTLVDRIRNGDRESALALIAGGADVHAPEADGTTPLHWAAYRVDAELVDALIARGARADVLNDYGSTPLAEAIRVADAPIVSALLDAGADPNRTNADGQSPLMLAARSGAVDVARRLVEAGADVNAPERFRDQTALMWAAAANHGEMVTFLVSAGADIAARAHANDWPNQMTSEPRVQYRPTGGLTPLLYAARAGCLDCVQAILGGGADIDTPNPDGMTALMMATDNAHDDVALFLLEMGANPHIWDWWGRTALYAAVNMRGGPDSHPGRREPASLELIHALLDAGVNPNSQLNMLQPGRDGSSGRFRDDLLNTGATPLLRAAQSFDNDVVRTLLAHGARVDLPNAMGVTPLLAAAGIGTRTGESVLGPGPPENVEELALATIEILLDAGADVNAQVRDTTSLTARIARTSTMTNREGQTALHFAAEMGRIAVVRFLLDRGASPLIADAAGRTPIDAARGHDEVRALLEAGQAR